MKFLHTADWHVGKTLRGRLRLDEQTRVLKEIVQLAITHQVDAVFVAGDLYDQAVPSADAQRLVVKTLLALAERGIEVVVIAGNHDHGATLEAWAPVMGVAGIHVRGTVRPADRGGVHRFTARSTGERCEIALVPFLSKRYAVRAAEIVSNTPAENVGRYDQQLRDLIGSLTASFTPGAVHVVMGHLTCIGAQFGGGEREAQSIFDYSVPASIFPQDTHYVALGHLHRRQQVEANCPVHYSGAPYPIDFGEQENTPVVCLVEATPTTPAAVTDLPLTGGRRLRTVTGTVAELVAAADTYGDDFLKVVITQPGYAGLLDEVRSALPNALDVRIHGDHAVTAPKASLSVETTRRSPVELFSDYLAERDFHDDRVTALFGDLVAELADSDTAGVG